jgi:hypothetical protein
VTNNYRGLDANNSLHHVYHRPRMCTPEDLWDTDQWLQDHPEIPCPADVMLAASQGFGVALTAMRVASGSAYRDRTRTKMVVHLLQDQASRWETAWFNDSREYLGRRRR